MTPDTLLTVAVPNLSVLVTAVLGSVGLLVLLTAARNLRS